MATITPHIQIFAPGATVPYIDDTSDTFEVHIRVDQGTAAQWEVYLNNDVGQFNSTPNQGDTVRILVQPEFENRERVFIAGTITTKEFSDSTHTVIKIQGLDWVSRLIGPLVTYTRTNVDAGQVVRDLASNYTDLDTTSVLNSGTLLSGKFSKRLEDAFDSISDALGTIGWSFRINPTTREIVLFPTGNEPRYITRWSWGTPYPIWFSAFTATPNNALRYIDNSLSIFTAVSDTRGVTSQLSTIGAQDSTFLLIFKKGGTTLSGITSSDAKTALYLYLNGPTSAYFIRFDAGSNTVSLFKTVSGIQTLITQVSFTFNLEQWYSMEVIYNPSGTTHTVKVNGTTVLSTTNADLTGTGAISLQGGSTAVAQEIRFSDLVVKDLASNNLFVDRFDFHSLILQNEDEALWVQSLGKLTLRAGAGLDRLVTLGGEYLDPTSTTIPSPDAQYVVKWTPVTVGSAGYVFNWQAVQGGADTNKNGYRIVDGSLNRYISNTLTALATWTAVGTNNNPIWYRTTVTGSLLKVESSTDGITYTTKTSFNDNNNVGTLTSPTYSTSLPPAGSTFSLLFNGTSDFVGVPDSTSLDVTGSLSIMAWVNTSSTGAIEVIHKRSGATGYFLDIGTDGVPGRVSFFTAGLSNTLLDSKTAVNDGKWHHIAGVFDSVAGKTFVYVDGIQESTVGVTGTMTASTVALAIGATSGGGGNFFNGNIDEVRIYNRGLSGSEVFDIASSSKDNRNGAISIWKFDEGTGTTANDTVLKGSSSGSFGYWGEASTTYSDTTYWKPSGDILDMDTDSHDHQVRKNMQQIVNRVQVVGTTVSLLDNFTGVLSDNWTDVNATGWNITTASALRNGGTVGQEILRSSTWASWDSANNSITVNLKKISGTTQDVSIMTFKTAAVDNQEVEWLENPAGGSTVDVKYKVNGVVKQSALGLAYPVTSLHTLLFQQNNTAISVSVDGSQVLTFSAAPVQVGYNVQLVSNQQNVTEWTSYLTNTARNVVAVSQDATSISVHGKKELLIADASIRTSSDAQRRANTELSIRKIERSTIDVQMDGNSTFAVGDTVILTASNVGIYATPFQIQSIEHTIHDDWITSLNLILIVPELIFLLGNYRAELRRLAVNTFTILDLIASLAETFPVFTDSISATTKTGGTYTVGTAIVGLSDIG